MSEPFSIRDMIERARGHKMTPEERAAQRESFIRSMRQPTDADLTPEQLQARYDEAAKLPENLRWTGEGPPPARWWADSTMVYRSYADYCDD